MSSKSSHPTLSAVVIAINEAELLPNCLESLSFCDEIIVVVDSRTTDETQAIAEQAGAKTFVRQFDNFAGQKNFGLRQAQSDWTLLLDADERVTPALRQEIAAAIQKNSWGYEIPIKPYVFGRLIKHSGWAPSYKLRLFRTGASYTGAVHEQITPAGKVGRLSEPFIHFNYFDVTHWNEQMNVYTTFEANKLKDAGVKFRPRMIITKPAREFAYRYIKQSGWRDGFMGLVLAGLMASYRLSAVLKLWELQRGGADAAEVYRRLDEGLLTDSPAKYVSKK